MFNDNQKWQNIQATLNSQNTQTERPRHTNENGQPRIQTEDYKHWWTKERHATQLQSGV